MTIIVLSVLLAICLTMLAAMAVVSFFATPAVPVKPAEPEERYICSDYWDGDESACVKLEINFDNGTISGACGGCDAAKVAEALATIVRKLQRCDGTPEYVYYDDGSVFVNCEEQVGYQP